jgi:D-sedoheptulose 7-phosphate isomerase
MAHGLIEKGMEVHAQASQELLQDKSLIASAELLAEKIIKCYSQGGKVILFGNGGSASQAAHIAAELSGKYIKDRAPLPAMDIASNIAATTAIGNDYGFDRVFSRQLEAFAKKGDVAIGISTSGNSKNVLEAIRLANAKGIFCAVLLGKNKCALDGIADIAIKVPSASTPRIQEMHLLVLHEVCAVVESRMFP